ncbi:MAG TPA: helix-turn-helix transcriptional regulator [Candidatus Elarobacter sp.]
MFQSFRERLRALREERALRVGGLANAVGVSDSAIRQMESGQTKSASFAVGLMLSRELHVSPWYLCFGEDGVLLETGVRSEEAAAKALESLILGRAALDQRVSTLEDQVAALKKRISRAD